MTKAGVFRVELELCGIDLKVSAQNRYFGSSCRAARIIFKLCIQYDAEELKIILGSAQKY